MKSYGNLTSNANDSFSPAHPGLTGGLELMYATRVSIIGEKAADRTTDRYQMSLQKTK